MFTYCNNNPIMYCDPLGTTTFGLSLGGNVTLGIGVSVSIGIFWDTEGNCEFQWSYVVPGVGDTSMVGLVDAGVGVTFQITDRETIYDLYGAATSVGASAGPGWYVGGDIISFSDASNTDSSINGVQLTAGVGIGLDVHVAESYTKAVLPQQSNKGTRNARRAVRPGYKNVEMDRLTY